MVSAVYSVTRSNQVQPGGSRRARHVAMYRCEESVVRMGSGDELWCDVDSQSGWKEPMDWTLKKNTTTTTIQQNMCDVYSSTTIPNTICLKRIYSVQWIFF